MHSEYDIKVEQVGDRDEHLERSKVVTAQVMTMIKSHKCRMETMEQRMQGGIVLHLGQAGFEWGFKSSRQVCVWGGGSRC